MSIVLNVNNVCSTAVTALSHSTSCLMVKLNFPFDSVNIRPTFGE